MNRVLNKLKHCCDISDSIWMKRKRKLDTFTLFSYLANVLVTGESLLMSKLKAGANVYNFQSISAPAISKARIKTKNIFRKIHDSMITKKRKRIYAVDGSKIQLFDSCVKGDFKPRDSTSKHPIGMISGVFDTVNKEIVSINLSKHLNERKAILEQKHLFNEHTTVLFDRGYYSLELFTKLQLTGCRMLFRLKRDAFSQIKKMYSCKIPLSRIIYFKDVKIRVVKCFVGKRPYYFATNMFNSTIDKLKSLYWKRWRIEEFYKSFKCVVNGKQWKTNRCELLEQEIYIRSIIYNLSIQIKGCLGKNHLRNDILVKGIVQCFVMILNGTLDEKTFIIIIVKNKTTKPTLSRQRIHNK